MTAILNGSTRVAKGDRVWWSLTILPGLPGVPLAGEVTAVSGDGTQCVVLEDDSQTSWMVVVTETRPVVCA